MSKKKKNNNITYICEVCGCPVIFIKKLFFFNKYFYFDCKCLKKFSSSKEAYNG
jgi:hypothetical protein